MKILSKLFLLFPLFMEMHCLEPGHFHVVVHNNSNETIAFYCADAWTNVYYPDTTLVDLRETIYLFTVNSHSTNGRSYEAYNWEYITRKWTKKDTLSIYIFNQSIFNQYSWGEIRDKYLIEARYDLSGSDLEVIRGRVSFPPDEKMKHVHMWPPYEELIAKYNHSSQ